MPVRFLKFRNDNFVSNTHQIQIWQRTEQGAVWMRSNETWTAIDQIPPFGFVERESTARLKFHSSSISVVRVCLRLGKIRFARSRRSGPFRYLLNEFWKIMLLNLMYKERLRRIRRTLNSGCDRCIVNSKGTRDFKQRLKLQAGPLN